MKIEEYVILVTGANRDSTFNLRNRRWRERHKKVYATERNISPP